MKKLAFTTGTFDCFGIEDLHLIKEMRKLVVPDKDIAVVLVDDYINFALTGKFPLQDRDRRKENLSYFVHKNDIDLLVIEKPFGLYDSIIERARNLGAQPIFVAFEDNPNFIGRDYLKSKNVPIRFIKKFMKPKC